LPVTGALTPVLIRQLEGALAAEEDTTDEIRFNSGEEIRRWLLGYQEPAPENDSTGTRETRLGPPPKTQSQAQDVDWSPFTPIQ
jgi:hypothetical protein